MAKKSIITNKGLELLATSSKVSGQYYWLGYYALAYVPNIWKTAQTHLPPCPPSDIHGVGDLPSDPLSYSMTKLTTHGDMIYNVFQGDLVGTGYARGSSDGSAGGNLFGLSQYNQSIKKHYRYVLDKDGHNNLVAWENDTSTTNTTQLGLMKGASIYVGTDGFIDTKMAIPAPIYYLGDVTGKLSVTDFFPGITDDVNSGASIYVSASYKYGANLDMTFPLVTSDYRGYLDTQNGNADATYAHQTTGSQFDSFEIPDAVDVGFSETSWFAAESTKVNITSGVRNGTLADAMWKNLSISNYNRFHAPVDSIGHIIQSDLANRNMAKTTKFFPISNYKVINSVTGFTVDNQYREVATSLALTIDIDLSPSTKGPGYDSEPNFDFDENPYLTFFDKYDRSTGAESLTQDDMYNTTHTSFKFNRIGIYAVPLMAAPYTLKKANSLGTVGTECDVEFQINPDIEPVLFAVVDFDNTVYLSDTGDGLHRFRGDINLNLDASNEIIQMDSSLVRDTVIFYNMYEDDAQTWYQNQLIATASTQNAIMEFGLELTHLKNRLAELACCPTPNFDDRYALKNHTHAKQLRNLVDATNATDGGLRGIDCSPDGFIGNMTGVQFNGQYMMGIDSVAIGSYSIAQSDFSFVYGVDSVIAGGTTDGTMTAQESSKGNANYSSILGAFSGVIYNSVYSLLGVGPSSSIKCLNGVGDFNVILAGPGNNILQNDSAHWSGFNTIISGSSTNIINGQNNFIGHGEGGVTFTRTNTCAILATPSTIMTDSSNSANLVAGGLSIINSSDSVVLCGGGGLIQNSHFVFMGAEGGCTILDSTYGAIISGGGNTLNTTNYSVILNGGGNHIIKSDNSLVGGSGNTLNGGSYNFLYGGGLLVGSVDGGGNPIDTSKYSFIFGIAHHVMDSNYISVTGSNNEITSSSYSAIDGGFDNTITNGSSYGFIGAGLNNLLYVAKYAGIIAGANNTIKNPSHIYADYTNLMLNPDYAVILGGQDCRADHYGEIARSNGKSVADAGTTDKVGFYQYNFSGTGDPNKYYSGPDEIYATTKHSSYMLSRRIDTWVLNEATGTPYFEIDSMGRITGHDPVVPYAQDAYLTLDGNMWTSTTNSDGEVSIPNCLYLLKGQSMSGTLKVMVHIPYSISSSCCNAGTDTTEYASGAVYHSLISFAAHRDGHGRVTVSSQLINESCADIAMSSVNDFGISTNILAWAEFDPAIIYADGASHGFKTESQTLTGSSTTHTEPHAVGYIDGHNDNTSFVGNNGTLLVQLRLVATDPTVLKNRFSSRYIFATAVLDTLVITTDDRLYPGFQINPS